MQLLISDNEYFLRDGFYKMIITCNQQKNIAKFQNIYINLTFSIKY